MKKLQIILIMVITAGTVYSVCQIYMGYKVYHLMNKETLMDTYNMGYKSGALNVLKSKSVFDWDKWRSDSLQMEKDLDGMGN